MSKKKMLEALGPFVLAVVLLLAVLYVPTNWSKRPHGQELKQGASSMSVNVIRGNVVKNAAIETGAYLPFFGSSELSRINPFHPSVLAAKYERAYAPFLLGAPGTQSLSHYFSLQSMAAELQEQPIVFVISPQWFVKDGVSDPMFSLYYSPLQTYQWLQNVTTTSEEAVVAATRLLGFTSISSDTTLSRLLEKVKVGTPLSSADLVLCRNQFHLLNREDMLFHKAHLANKTGRIERATEQLPATYELTHLEELANQLGATKTSNNPFGIANGFYSKRIAPLNGKLAGSQQRYNYLSSPEFSDFQLVLNQLAKNKTRVLFVIPPVNKKWSDYTGLSEEMLDAFSRKITYQLHSQGFTAVADYTSKRGEAYFMEDTIHLGWRGWLALDQDLQSFLAQQTAPHYTLNNQEFFSQDWQTKSDY